MAKKTLNFIETIEDKFGEFLVYDEAKHKEEIKAIPTGALSLDVCIGVGGIPLRRFTEIFGPESSGKTTLALAICKNAIKEGYNILYIDAENTLDFEYARAIIGDFDTTKFLLVQPETAEQALQIAENGIQSKEFGIVILDSIGSLAPDKVKKDDLTDSNVALLSRIMTTFVQRNAFTVRESDVAFIGINQVRDKIGSYIRDFETPGGHAWKHVLSLRIQLSKSLNIEQEDKIIGINSKFVIKKNKVAPPFRSFTIPLMFGKGIDEIRDVVNFAEMLGVLEKGGPFYKFEGSTLASGLANTIEYLKQNIETLDKVKQSCYTLISSEKKGVINEGL